VYVFYTNHQIDVEIARQHKNKKARQSFTLTESQQYGELLLPEGTRIERYDSFDNGEENRAFRLTGLRYKVCGTPPPC